MERLILADESLAEIGFLDFDIDLELGDSNDFVIYIPYPEWDGKLQPGMYAYIPGTEYGGVIRVISGNTKEDQIQIMGTTWRGMLAQRFICPPAGSDYFTVSGELNSCIRAVMGTPIIARSQYERVQKIRSMRRMQHSRADAVMGACIQYPIGDKLRCPYCGSALYQRSLPVQSTRTSGWCCERGEDACRGFIMRSGLIEKALLDAYSTLDERKVKEKLKSPKFSSAAKKALKIKKEHPALTRVDFWWVDELIDHVTFGAHSKEPRELRRLEALGIPYEDDRLVRVYWRCGLITTVPSGVISDRDHPVYVAKLYNDYLERKAKKEEAV